MKNLRYHKLIAIGAGAVVLTTASASAQIVGAKFDFYGYLGDSTYVAGARQQKGWNNLVLPAATSGSVADLNDSTGVATTLDIVWNSNVTGTADDARNAVLQQSWTADSAGVHNRELLNSFINGPTTSVSLAQIPYPCYDVIVYFNAKNAGQTGSVTDGATTYYFKTTGSDALTDPASVVQTTHTAYDASGANYPTANMAIFRKRSGASKNISASIANGGVVLNGGGIAGFQVIPVPATLELTPVIPDVSKAAVIWTGVKTGVTTVDTSNYNTLNDEVIRAGFAYLHPQSPYYHQQPVLDRLLLLLDTLFNPASGRPAYTSYGFKVYAMLKGLEPEKIPGAKQLLWDGWITAAIPGFISAYGIPFTVPYKIQDEELNLTYPWAHRVYFGGMAVGSQVWTEQGRRAIEDNMTRTLLGDGGTHYVGFQNEGTTYHGVVIWELLDYWIHNRVPAMNHMLYESRIYTALQIHAFGGGKFGEWSSNPAWKQSYNGQIPGGADIGSLVANDGYSATLAGTGISYYGAFMYRPVTTVPLPDNFTVFDRNIQGPRLRYGAYGAVGVGRNVQFGAPEVISAATGNHEGKNSLAGSFILSPTGGLQAAFHGAAPQIKKAAGAEIDYNRGSKVNNFLTMNEQTQTTRSYEVFGQASRYNPNKQYFTTTSTELAWTFMQQWVFTKDRVIGMTEAESNAQTSLYGLSQRIQFVGGLTQVDDNNFTGPLNLKIHAKNWGGPVTYARWPLGSSQQPMIELHDVNSSTASTTLSVFPANTKRYAIMEITSNGVAPAADVASIVPGNGLQGFEFAENGNRKVRLMHNPTAAAITYADGLVSPFAQTRLLKSWDVENPQSLAVASGNTSVSISIPAYGHITLINSGITTDHTGTFRYAEDVFLGYEPMKDGQIYEIQPKLANDLRMEVSASSGANGAGIVLAKATMGLNQRWLAQKQTDGSFELIPQHNTTKRIDVNARSAANGAALISWQDNNGTNQRWKARKQDDGCVELSPGHASGSRAQIRAGVAAVGTPVEIWADNNQHEQRWKLLEVK